MEYITFRLIKVLTDAGLRSRQKMADVIRDGRGEVSGVIVVIGW